MLFLALAGGYLFKDRLDRQDRQTDLIAAQLTALTAQVAVISQWGPRLDRIETEIASLRSDLTQVALAVGARMRPQTG
jgi:hypothetical protein